MSIVIVGIDLGKNSCSVVGLDEGGKVVVRRRMRRDGVIAFAANLTPCTMAMDACCGAHHMGRALAAPGHEVRRMSPEYVRPYVKAQKNDDRDAEAIAEAATRPTMRFVELKSEEQLDIQTNDELDRLIEAINKMSSSLSLSQRTTQAAVDSLRQAKDELEIRVRQRTSDLSEVNNKLSQEVAERHPGH